MKNKIKIISDFNMDVFYNLLSRKIDTKKYIIIKHTQFSVQKEKNQSTYYYNKRNKPIHCDSDVKAG